MPAAAPSGLDICTHSAFCAEEPSGLLEFPRPNKFPSELARPLSAFLRNEPKIFASKLCPIDFRLSPLPVATNWAS